MAIEIEEIVDDSIEEIGMDAVMEKEKKEAKRGGSAWENWVALSSSLLAVLSAIAALLATFESDKAAVADADETTYAAYTEGVSASYHVLQTKADLLAAMGKSLDAKEMDKLAKMKAQVEAMKAKAEAYDKKGKASYRAHDHYAIAVTLFQLTILLGGLAALLQRRIIWLFGLLFSLGGFGFFAIGLMGL